MSFYNIGASTDECTVVTEYTPKQNRSDAYQSEAALEDAFIKMLTQQGYVYLDIHSSDDMIANLRMQLERLNRYTFTDEEWADFYHEVLANVNEGIVEKTRWQLQEHYAD